MATIFEQAVMPNPTASAAGPSAARWLLAVLVAMSAALGDQLADPTRLTSKIGEHADDLRLHQVREWLGGKGWFDLSLDRFVAAEPLVSPLSRLIDLPIGAMITAFDAAGFSDVGEFGTRLLWPLLLLVFGAALIIGEANRRAGLAAAVAAACLLAMSPRALEAFEPGRIGHLGAVFVAMAGGLILLCRSIDAPRVGLAAGSLLALALSISPGSAPVVALALGAAAIAAALDQRASHGIALATLGLAAALAAIFAATVAAEDWLLGRCDAPSLGWVCMAGIVCLGLWALGGAGAFRSLAARLGCLALTLGAGLISVAVVQPHCLANVFGDLGSMGNFPSAEQIATTLQSGAWPERQPEAALAYLVAGVAAVVFEIVELHRRRTTESGLRLGIVGGAVGLGLAFPAVAAFATLIAIPSIAVGVITLFPSAGMPSIVARIAAIVALTPVVSIQVFAVGVGALRDGDSIPAVPPRHAAAECRQVDEIRALTALPPGLVAADSELTAAIVLETSHRIVAPRPFGGGKPTLAATDVLDDEAGDEFATLIEFNVDYVVTCVTAIDISGRAQVGSLHTVRPLRERLRGGEAVPFLQPIELPAAAGALSAWRVLR